MNIKFLNDGEEFDIGDTIRIETTIEEQLPFEETSSLVDPAQITITITGYNNNEVVSQEDMTKDSKGKYFFNWNTNGLDPGDYEVETAASANGATDNEDDYIRITD